MIPYVLALALMPAEGTPAVLVREDHTKDKKPLQILVHKPAGDSPETLGAPITSDLKFMKAEGSNPTMFVFPADVQGDGTDEIVHVRHRIKKGDDVEVRVYKPPFFQNGDVGKPVSKSKKKTLGKAVGDGRILLMTGGDHDGDGRSSAYIIREFDDGTQTLEVRPLPKKKKKKMSKVQASDPTFGDAFTDTNIHLAAADVDHDGVDEIVVVRKGADLVPRLLVFEPPQELEQETDPPILTDDDITPIDGATVVSIGRLSLDKSLPDRLAVLASNPLFGTRLDVFAFPAAPGGDIGEPLFQDLGVSAVGATDPARWVFDIRGYAPKPPPPPPANLAGSYVAQFTHVVDGSAEAIPGLPAIQATQGGGVVQFLFPVFNTVSGVYSQQDAKVDFTGQVAEIDVPQFGWTYLLDLSVADVTKKGSVVTIQGTYTGVRKEPLNQESPVTAGVFVLTRQ